MLNLSTATVLPNSLSTFPKSSFSGIQIRHSCPVPIRVPVKMTRSLSGNSLPSVVMMAKREEELKEIRGMSTEQINEEVVDLKGELFMLRLQKSVRNEFKSSEFRRMRKRVCFPFVPFFFQLNFVKWKNLFWLCSNFL